jgi:hypothetical protein
MSEIDELRRRIDALEAEMAILREESAATRVLASMNDRDVAEFRTELRAHRQVLNALRETQVEHGRRLEALEKKTVEGFQRMDENFAEVRRGFATVLTAVQGIADRL